MSRFGDVVERVVAAVTRNEDMPGNVDTGVVPQVNREWSEATKTGSEGGLFARIRPGSMVTIVTLKWVRLKGRAVMRGPAGWVLNLGGRHGVPGIADEDNVVAVRG